MEITEAKQRFIEHWGKMGTEWGINRCMAQIHALLLITPHPLCAEKIMEDLCISRGSVNINLRALIDWGLVEKKLKPGERKEYFMGEKDLWTVFKCIIENRRKRELEPLIHEMHELQQVNGDSKETEEYLKIINGISRMTAKADSILDILMRLDESWLLKRSFSPLP